VVEEGRGRVLLAVCLVVRDTTGVMAGASQAEEVDAADAAEIHRMQVLYPVSDISTHYTLLTMCLAK